MKRILFVDHVNRILGGAELNLIEILTAILKLKEWQVACACSHGGGLSNALNNLDVPQYDYGFARSLNEARFVQRNFSLITSVRGMMALPEARTRLEQIIIAFRPDVIVSCTNKDHFCAGPLGTKHSIPSVWWVNDIISAEFFSWPVRATFRSQAKRHAKRLVVVSDYARQALVKEGLPSESVRVVHNGISLHQFEKTDSELFRELCGLPPQEPLVGIIGRYTPWKGQDFFLRLAQAWIKESPIGHFVLIGRAFNEDEAYEQELRRFVQENQLGKRVHFIPFQTNIAVALRELSVMVHASTRPEPFGRVVIESMAAGTPVIAARAGGVTEIITHGVDGLLAQPGNLEEYLNGLRQLLNSKKDRAELAEAGKKTVAEKFTREHVWRQFEGTLREIC